jgi:hypothetical protein
MRSTASLRGVQAARPKLFRSADSAALVLNAPQKVANEHVNTRL